MKIRFACPSCDRPAQVERPGSERWQCPACDHVLTFPAEAPRSPLHACGICGTTELYKKKDFPHWLGLGILTVACAAFLITNAIYHQWWAWAILIGSAIFDGLLFLWVGDVIVCYRCGAHHRGLAPDPAYQPYELSIAERYRQERLRQQQLNQTSQ